jgi:hypothetical protein
VRLQLHIPYAIYTTTPDGVVVTRLVDSGGDPAWMPMPVPVATFTFTCKWEHLRL